MGQSIPPQQKSWSLLPPRPRNAIPESIASHSSLFPSLSLSLSLWPISGDSSSCRRRPKNRRGGSYWRDSRYKTRVLTAGHFSSQHVALYTKNKIPLLKLIFVLSFIISNNITQVHILQQQWFYCDFQKIQIKITQDIFQEEINRIECSNTVGITDKL